MSNFIRLEHDVSLNHLSLFKCTVIFKIHLRALEFTSENFQTRMNLFQIHIPEISLYTRVNTNCLITFTTVENAIWSTLSNHRFKIFSTKL